LQKTDFYRPEYQKRKDEICPFSSLAFLQPTTVDKEPKNAYYQVLKKLDTMRFNVGRFTFFLLKLSCYPRSFYTQ
ncbi:hypothetical protein RLK20_05390, partial [Streptococcus pneumoniae]|nr:hypothetical protein [Streptococcus pneumoniae]MDS8833036.1 hypothetical protein [Streptococcus pneumoniae]